MKFIKYIGLAVIALGVASCGSTAKTGEQSPVQSPLKLSSAGEVLSQTCASYGCDEVLRKRCDVEYNPKRIGENFVQMCPAGRFETD